MTINKAYEENKRWFWSQPHAVGTQLHHIYGRTGYLKACRIFMIGLIPCMHSDWSVIGDLRKDFRSKKLEADKNFKNGECQRAIDMKCLNCGLLKIEPLREDK